MASLFDGLPAPVNKVAKETTRQSDEDEARSGRPATTAAATAALPKYGERERRGFVPRKQSDFGDGGAYPEIHVAQYPRGMGKEDSRGNVSRRDQTLALTVSGTGEVDYGALHRQGGNRGKTVYSDHKSIVPSLPTDSDGLEKPTQDEVEETKRRTMAALQGKVDLVLSAAQPKSLAARPGDAKYVKYTPANSSAQGSQRIIRISEAHVDPLEPPKFKHKKVPRGPGSPPVPVLHSPPRKLTQQDQEDWKIPPCISNWKNRKGYTIPLDKRLAADGRGLQEVQINDNFAKLSEALYVAEGKAREAIEMRSKIQKEILAKEKTKKEDQLRQLAQRARLERSGLGAAALAMADPTEEDPRTGPAMGEGPGYEDLGADAAGVGGPTYDGPGASSMGGTGAPPGGDDEDETAEDRALRMKREELREERRRERERERRLEDKQRHGFKKSKLTRDRERDISEKVALGQASVGPTSGGEALYDQRLFNQDKGMSSGLANEDVYNIYDKPLFADKGNSIYRPKQTSDVELYGQEDTEAAIRTERFKADKGFAGADAGAGPSVRGGGRLGGPVQFEREEAPKEEDPFDLEGLIGDVRGGKKKPLEDIGKGGFMSANAGGADFSSSGRKNVEFRKGSK